MRTSYLANLTLALAIYLGGIVLVDPLGSPYLCRNTVRHVEGRNFETSCQARVEQTSHMRRGTLEDGLVVDRSEAKQSRNAQSTA
jgi:hypothetical protein